MGGVVLDDFSVDTIADYTSTGGAIAIVSGALGRSGTATGTRNVMHSRWLNGDDGYVAYTLNGAIQATNFTSLQFRMNDAKDRYVALHVRGNTPNVFLQRANSAGVVADFTSATQTIASGARIMVMFTGGRYQVFHNGTRFIDFTDPGAGVISKGIGFRRIGLRFDQSASATFAQAVTVFEGSDLLQPGNKWDIPDVTPARNASRPLSVNRASER